MGLEPGWYADQLDPRKERFWDGATWTDRTRSVEADGASQGSAVPEPGWYHDPLNSTRTRFWDGATWLGLEDENPPPPSGRIVARGRGPAGKKPEAGSGAAASSDRRIGWMVIAGAAAIILIVANLGGGGGTRPHTSTEVSVPTCKNIVYEVTGTARSVSLTMADQDGDTVQVDSAGVPLTNQRGESGLQIGCMLPGEFAYLSAQNNGDSGTVTCWIKADGVVISTATSRGAFVIASCSESIP